MPTYNQQVTKMESNKVIDLIICELKKAEEKHPGWPTDRIHAVSIIAEEVDEAMQEAIDITYFQNGSEERLIKELAQTGAMAIRALKSIELQRKEDTVQAAC